MVLRYDQGREPLRQSPQTLSHRISNISEISDFETNPYDTTSDTHVIRPRESLVSVNSQAGYRASSSEWDTVDVRGHASTPTRTNWQGSFPYTGAGGGAGAERGYSPVAHSPSSSSRSYHSRSQRKSRYGNPFGVGIEENADEEAYDLSLLGSAYPMGGTERRYQPIIKQQERETHVTADGTSPMDLSSGMGPTTAHDEAFMRSLQEQEARGTLTGGLGKGFRADARVRDEELLSLPPTPTSGLSRSLSRRNSRKEHLTRADTIRTMGQDEANRRGEVIEVIMEEPAGQDLSSMEGPTTFEAEDISRQSIGFAAGRRTTTQLFFPQPNWKPFPMRWPYLIFLIWISAALAAMQEILYQKYKHNPILKFKAPGEVNPAIYVAVKFAPTLAAVVFGVLWQFTDFEVRRLEAYYQLSRQGGALAAESINVDYVTAFNFFRPIQALRLGHYAVALSSVATTLAISLVPTFAAASVLLTPDRQKRMEDPDGWKELKFASVWSRLLTVTLGICAVCGMGLFYVLQSRRSGLLADVRGIAGLASMAVVSHILMDFKDLDTADPNVIHRKLKYNRYVLRNSSLAPDDENPVTSHERNRLEDERKVSTNPHPFMLRPLGNIGFSVLLLIFLGFIPAFLFSPASVVSEKAPFVITAIAVCIKLAWTSMETAVRMMEPFYLLSRRHAHSKVLTLDYTALPFGWMPIQAILNRHVLVFLVGLGSVMVEFLTILVTGLASVDGQGFLESYDKNSTSSSPSHHRRADDEADDASDINSGQETTRSFYTSLGLALFILLYMLVVNLVVFLRRRHPFLPRQPRTIASILAFIHQSKMLYDFVDTEKLSTSEMRSRLNDGSTYGLGWFEGRDGTTHCGVDREELQAKYTHGMDYSAGNKPWNTAWDVL